MTSTPHTWKRREDGVLVEEWQDWVGGEDGETHQPVLRCTVCGGSQCRACFDLNGSDDCIGPPD